MNHLTKYGLIIKSQHGFVKKKNCSTNLLEYIDLLTYGLANGKSFDILYTDFAKAFDRVSHRRLLIKLKAYGVSGNVLNWIEDFLKDRKQRVIMGDCISDWCDIHSGVPQGSVLGPIFFVIFINDLPSRVKNSICKLYADDNKLISEIKDLADCLKMQEDIDELVKWSEEWLLGFNTEKCKIMHIGKKNPNFVYEMKSNGQKLALETTILERDLGVMISSNLKWENQVDAVVAKANSVLGRISKSFTYKGKELIRSLYCTFVRPLLEFAVPVWSPYQKGDIKKIEGVQSRATKLIPELRHFSSEDRLTKLRLTTMETRRTRGDIIQFYKLKNGIESINWHHPPSIASALLSSGPAASTRGHRHRLERELVKNCAQRDNFFTNRIVNVWNNLPKEIIEAISVDSLKAKLDTFLK